MPGFNQSQLAYKARNANTVTVLIGDQPVAFAQSVTHSFDLGTEGLYGVGTAKPQEIQQLKVAPTITITQIDLTTLGQTQLQGNQVTFAELLANNEFVLHVVDGTSGQALFTYTGCVAQGFSQDIPSNQVITDNITFLAKDVLGLNGQSILNGPAAITV